MQEFFSEATFYGADKIMRLYSGFPRFLPLPVSIQHGWTLAASPAHALEEAPENWYWSLATEQNFRRTYPKVTTRTVGSPFLYLLKLLTYTLLPPDAQRGSIVFPAHSAPRITMTCNFDEYADMLAELPEAYQPITVCLYYSDLARGLAAPFLRKGFQVVSNGASRYDPDFLWNFVRNTHGKRFAFSNQMTSALLFATAMGLTSYFWGPAFTVHNPNRFWQQRDYTQYHRGWEAQYRNIFAFPNNDWPTQQAVVATELGVTHMLTPPEMRRLLWRLTLHPKYAQQVKNAGISYVRQTRAWKLARQLRATLSSPHRKWLRSFLRFE